MSFIRRVPGELPGVGDHDRLGVVSRDHSEALEEAARIPGRKAEGLSEVVRVVHAARDLALLLDDADQVRVKSLPGAGLARFSFGERVLRFGGALTFV